MIVAVFILALWAAFAWFIHEDIRALIREQQDEDDA